MNTVRIRPKADRVRRVIILNATLFLAAAILLTLEYFGLLRTVCWTYFIFGLYCPGCGMTRLCRAALDLDLYQAFRFNPLMFIFIPIWGVMYLVETVKYLHRGILSKYLNHVLIAMGIAMVIYGLIRNFAIFSFLAPTQI